MIVWSGWGILVVLIAGLAAGIGVAAGGTAHASLGMGLGAILGAVGIWFLGRRLNGPTSERLLVDPKTGQQVMLRCKNTLFWINMEWWAIVVALLGVIALFAH